MAIVIDYSDAATPRFIIKIPRTDMTLVSSSPSEIRTLDLNAFRLELNNLMDDAVPGIVFSTNHSYVPPIQAGDVLLFRVVTILAPYVVEFEDGLYNVNVIGGNSNVSNVALKNQVGVNTANSAGGQIISSGSALSAEESQWLRELHQFRGLDSVNPLTITDTTQTVDGQTVTVSDDGTTTTVARE